MRRTLAAGTVALSLFVPLGCGAAADDTKAAPESRQGTGQGMLLVADGVRRAAPATDAPVSPAISGLTAFGHELLATMGDKNLVVSPLSIGYAFGMADAGARGTSKTEIERTLGFPPGGPHQALNALTQQIGAQDTPPPRAQPGAKRTPGSKAEPPVLALANGLFVDRNLHVEQDFLRLLAEQYGAGARTADFTGGKAADDVNAWVDKQTAGRISKLFEKLDPDVRMVLANAVYLKADWAARFEKSATKSESFRRAAGEVRVPMMHHQASLRHAAGPGWQAVELPYAGGELAMWVLVPTGDTAPADLLAPKTLAAVGSGLTAKQVQVALPQWDFATDADLKPLLTKLGMTVPFDPAKADFSGITGQDNMYIAQAVHRANITVDENGTEAAAVTGLGMGVVSMPPPPEATVRADHPFAFAIVHTKTKAPLFLGQVTDPTQH
jgi:serine protease inhibitor